MPHPDPWAPTDPLGRALHFLRMNGAFYCRSELTEPWVLNELGYRSEAAFARAFKRAMGTSPGAVRREASTALAMLD